MIGKQLPYIGIGLINYLTLVALAEFVFAVPMKGSMPTLSLAALFACAMPSFAHDYKAGELTQIVR